MQDTCQAHNVPNERLAVEAGRPAAADRIDRWNHEKTRPKAFLSIAH